MRSYTFLLFALCSVFSLSAAQTPSATTESTAETSTIEATTGVTTSPEPTVSSGGGTSSNATTSLGAGTGTTTSAGSSSTKGPPDVLLKVPNLSVKRIELIVDNLQAEINLNAEIASLVTINAGVEVSVSKVNITIADVEAELELIIRLGNLVSIVNRTLATLDLNPLLINLLNEVTDVVTEVVAAVDSLLGSIVQGNSKINFIIDNLGNIVQEVVGDVGNTVSTIVGNFEQNMTFTGDAKTLSGGLVQKTYKYEPLGDSRQLHVVGRIDEHDERHHRDGRHHGACKHGGGNYCHGGCTDLR
ncbi:hypothetical protein UCDDA912_g00518 [Diaporthe ampelina]|uniref:Uncharacterized protein n=1 Tax=Diaporthe ampelina TaxID=1214573 RepID=A0A0G2IG69_9PEZI|nr:hypothetical protein UCDDA912_g00518 [Diaporthe ampelina]